MDNIVLDRSNRLPERQTASWPAATPVWPSEGATITPGARARESLLQPLATTSTAWLPAAAQFKAWRQRCAPVIEMIEPLGARPGYLASSTTWKFGPFALSTVLAPAARYRRTRRQIRRDALDHWAISITRRGTHSMRTESGDSTARTGLPYIFSFANAFEGQCSGVDWLGLFVPRETFPELGPVIDRCLHLSLESGLAQLLACYLSSLEARLPTVTEAELPRLVAATRAVVGACVVPSAEAREPIAVDLGWARRERVRQAIRQNLRSPRLTPSRLCRMVGMSRSQLYRLFEAGGGVARYIQSERLREAHRAISEPDSRRAIHEIAADLGFFDASTFSRVFRREFSCTPSDVRMGALAGERNAPVRRPVIPERSRVPPLDFATMLGQL